MLYLMKTGICVRVGYCKDGNLLSTFRRYRTNSSDPILLGWSLGSRHDEYMILGRLSKQYTATHKYWYPDESAVIREWKNWCLDIDLEASNLTGNDLIDYIKGIDKLTKQP